MEFIDFAIVHHSNQYMITNGYTNREGLEDVLGIRGGATGSLRIFQLHEAYKIRFNLHISGTLLETILWHCPFLLPYFKRLRRKGLLGLIGSCYGQNIMRFFNDEHNFRQLNEEIKLYREHLDVKPRDLKVFWPPERVWDRKSLAPLLTSRRLLNGGYESVLIDDRLLYSLPSRKVFDEGQKRRIASFSPYQIFRANGLTALPISFFLRQHIPPRGRDNLEQLEEFFHWLATKNSRARRRLVAIYADDLEKTAGCCGWDEGGPDHYEAFLQWLARNPWVRPIRLNDWTPRRQVNTCRRSIELGTYFEMSQIFGAGEGYENWYRSREWAPYRDYYAWSEEKVKQAALNGGDPALLELAWKQLLASSWETAWHVPAYGVHGKTSSLSGPSPWAKAIASHSRVAAVIAEAAYWMKHKDGKAHSSVCDIDRDDHQELILKNDKLFAVISPSHGGRLIYLFDIAGRDGKMVVGNPCDDWNWMEELNKYMEIPANHPGALAESGHENDRYKPAVMKGHGDDTGAVLINREKHSEIFGLAKSFRLGRMADEIEVTYSFPGKSPNLSIEFGLSPDYLHLLRFGSNNLREMRDLNCRGYSNNGTSVWVRLDDLTKTLFSQSAPRQFGHGYAFRVDCLNRSFTLRVGVKQAGRPMRVGGGKQVR